MPALGTIVAMLVAAGFFIISATWVAGKWKVLPYNPVKPNDPPGFMSQGLSAIKWVVIGTVAWQLGTFLMGTTGKWVKK